MSKTLEMCAVKNISSFIKSLLIIIIISALQSCSYFNNKSDNSPGLPLVGYVFNGTLENDGILNISVLCKEEVSYSVGVSDSCLDLTKKSSSRLPLNFLFPEQYNVDDYDGFSVVFWVKKPADDIEEYMLASQYTEDYLGNFVGWKIISNATGAWKWMMSDGIELWLYNPGFPRQRINDDNWHQIAFSYNKTTKEVRHYFDGVNVAVISVDDCGNLYNSNPISFGGNPDSFEKRRDTFNGCLDDFSYWGRPLADNEVVGLFAKTAKKTIKDKVLAGNRFSVMTWNIYHGGEYLGKTVGIERIVEIIKNSGADIVCFQETYGGGEKIADRLGFYFYRRSENISLISRFPIETTFNVFKKEHSGGARIILDENRSVTIYPIWLSPQPDVGAYVRSGIVSVDSLLIWEHSTRGVEMRFILSEIPKVVEGSSLNTIVAGNFNSGSHLDWTERNKNNKNGMVIPFSITQLLENNGFVDSYREVLPDEMAHTGNTWSPLFKEIFSNRIDFIFYKGSNIKAVNSRVIDHHRLGFPSDHALVISEFEIIE